MFFFGRVSFAVFFFGSWEESTPRKRITPWTCFYFCCCRFFFFFFAPGAFTSHGWQLNSTGRRNVPGFFLFVLTVFGPLKRSWVNGSGISFGFCGFQRGFFRQKSEVDARMNGQHHQKMRYFWENLKIRITINKKHLLFFQLGIPFILGGSTSQLMKICNRSHQTSIFHCRTDRVSMSLHWMTFQKSTRKPLPFFLYLEWKTTHKQSNIYIYINNYIYKYNYIFIYIYR